MGELMAFSEGKIPYFFLVYKIRVLVYAQRPAALEGM
jgi:hypothetical protein